MQMDDPGAKGEKTGSCTRTVEPSRARHRRRIAPLSPPRQDSKSLSRYYPATTRSILASLGLNCAPNQPGFERHKLYFTPLPFQQGHSSTQGKLRSHLFSFPLSLFHWVQGSPLAVATAAQY